MSQGRVWGVRGGTGGSGVGLGSQGRDWGIRGGTGESGAGLGSGAGFEEGMR